MVESMYKKGLSDNRQGVFDLNGYTVLLTDMVRPGLVNLTLRVNGSNAFVTGTVVPSGYDIKIHSVGLGIYREYGTYDTVRESAEQYVKLIGTSNWPTQYVIGRLLQFKSESPRINS